MKKGKYIYSLIYMLILLAVTGCSSSVAIKANSDKSADIKLNIDISGSVQNLLDSYDVAIDAESVEQLGKSLEAYSFHNVKASSKSKSSISIDGTIKDSTQQNAIAITDSSLDLTISPKSMQALLESMPEESRYYFDLFAAPVFTGEEMNKEEYTELLSVIYGNDIAGEIEKAILKITLESPAGKKTVFKLPVIDFLTLNSEKTFSIKY